MQNAFDPTSLVGKRYVTDFRIVAITPGDDGEPEATLLMYGDTYKLSVAELEVIIERGFVTEAPQRP